MASLSTNVSRLKSILADLDVEQESAESVAFQLIRQARSGISDAIVFIEQIKNQ